MTDLQQASADGRAEASFADADKDTILERRSRLTLSMLASCGCDTKTPDPAFHEPWCRYKALCAEVAALERLPANLALAAPDLAEAAQQMVSDYQTSEAHHPNHVLVPLSAFEALRAAIAKATLDTSKGEG